MLGDHASKRNSVLRSTRRDYSPCTSWPTSHEGWWGRMKWLIALPLRCLATLGAVLAYGIVWAAGERPWNLRVDLDFIWGRQR
jgi:hypothetical protein